MKNIDNVKTLKSEYCEHAKVCEILFGENGKKQHKLKVKYPDSFLKNDIFCHNDKNCQRLKQPKTKLHSTELDLT